MYRSNRSFNIPHPQAYPGHLNLTACNLPGSGEFDLRHLLKSSCHPSHTKQSIPFSMALRLRRICSTDEFFNTGSDALTTHLIKRGYPHRFIKEEIEKVRYIPRSKALETSMKNQSNRIPFAGNI